MSSYNKYMKIKKVINKSRIYGGNESLKHLDGLNFANYLNKSCKKKCIQIKLHPDESGVESFKSYLGFPTTKRAQATFKQQFNKIVDDLIDGHMTLLSLLIDDKSGKHALLLYFDKKAKNLEVIDTNGKLSEQNTIFENYDFIYNMIISIQEELSARTNKSISITEIEENINLQDGGHCDALSYFYAVLRKESKSLSNKIFSINWRKPENIKKLNAYIKSKNINSLLKLEGFILKSKQK